MDDEKVSELRDKIEKVDVIAGKDLGITDMKIDACLLAGKEFTEKNFKNSLKVDKDEVGHLNSYSITS